MRYHTLIALTTLLPFYIRAEYISKPLYDKLKYTSGIAWRKLDKSLQTLEWMETTYARII